MVDLTAPPKVAKSGRSFDFAGYRVRLEAPAGDTGVPDVVKFLVDVIEARQGNAATISAAQDAHLEIGAALLRAEELPEEVEGGLRVALERLSTVISDLEADR